MEKKKILYLLSSNTFSGAENVVCTIIDNLKNKYECLYCSPDGSIAETLKCKNIDFYPLKKFSYNEVKTAIREFNPDIIHANDIKASVIASFFSKKAKVVSHIHKNDPKLKSISIKSLIYYVRVHSFTNVIGVSDSIYNEFVFKKSLNGKYITIPNYIDSNHIIDMANNGISNEKYDCCYLGRLVDEKNPMFFIKIIKELTNEHKDIKAIMIGEGPMKEKCLSLITELGLDNNIKLIGFLSNPYPFLKNSKVCFMPSKYEGFGLVAIESLILGVPVLNSGNGGLKEIFKNDLEWYICNSIEEYVTKYKKIVNETNEKINLKSISSFTNLKKWRNKFEKIYQ